MRLGRLVSTLLMVAGLSAAALGAATLARDGMAAEGYRALARQVAPTGDGAGGGDGEGPEAVDWRALLAQNGSACAWLRVDGTTVDVPVLATGADDPDKWLYTDLWGRASDTGAPYLDHRCDPNGDVMVVYGHRTAYESYLFHDVSPLFEQGSLDAVGTATWDTPDVGPTSFRPLCAASVDMGDARWRRCSFPSREDLREWLAWALGEADAVRAGSPGLAARAERALLLVTCNGRALYPQTRTVAVFVA